MKTITIALPKGKRLLGSAYQAFKKAGISSQALESEMTDAKGKLLEFISDCGNYNFILVKVADIPQYIDRNWAELGVAGFDNYREYELENATLKNSLRGDNFVSDLLPDLALCPQSRFCVAGLPETLDFYKSCKNSEEKILTVATSNPAIANHYFSSKGIMADIITIDGSSEVMPKFGGVDCIFDIVESGSALKENGLIIYEEAMQIKTKVLFSKAALKYSDKTQRILEDLQNALQ